MAVVSASARRVAARRVSALRASALYLCMSLAPAEPCFRKAAMKTTGKAPRRDRAAVQLYHLVRRGGHGRRAETVVHLYWLALCKALMATAALMATTMCVGELDATDTV